MQWIVTEADRLSSGLDRDEFLEGEEIPVKEFKLTRLVPIFEEISIDQEKQISKLSDFKWCYDLKPISPTSIFPQKRGEQEDPKDYERLYESFLIALNGLIHKEDSLYLWMQYFDSVLKKIYFFYPSS